MTKYDDALKFYNKAIEINQNYGEAYNNKGSCLRELKRFDEALSCCNKAIKIIPEYSNA